LFIDQLASVRMLPWAKANLNLTGQALIICTVAGLAYFVAGFTKNRLPLILSVSKKSVEFSKN
jgi:hypothetical protein